MFKFTEKLLLARQLNLQRGEISLLKQPVQITPSVALANLSKIMTEKNLAHILYTTERDGLPAFVSELRSLYKVEGSKLASLVRDLAETAGWGYIEIQKFDVSTGHVLLKLDKAPISSLIGSKFGKQIDHIERGLIVGAFREIQTDYSLEGFETKCVSKGDPYCEVTVKPIHDFEKESIKPLLWQITGE